MPIQNTVYVEAVFFTNYPEHNYYLNSCTLAAPKVMIIDEEGEPLQDKYYEVDSTIKLSCIVRDVTMAASVVYWNHSHQILNYDTTRGGIRYVGHVPFITLYPKNHRPYRTVCGVPIADCQ